MCLPYGFLKCFVQLEGWLTFVLGIVAIVAAIIITVIQQGFDAAMKDLGITDINTSIIIVPFWAFAGIVMILAICGLCGAKYRNKCLLAVFNIGNICLFLAFLSISIAALAAAAGFDKEACPQETITDVNGPEFLYARAELTLCKAPCQCYYSEKMNKEVESTVINYSSTDKSKPVRTQDCPGFEKGQELQAAALSLMEENWECSGWCKGYPIQLFTDVNSNVKGYNNPCFRAMMNYFRDIFNATGGIMISLAILFGIMVIFTCCLCFHKQNSNKGQDYYTRLAYTAD